MDEVIRPKYVIVAVLATGLFVFFLIMSVYGQLVRETYYSLIDNQSEKKESVLHPSDLSFFNLDNVSVRTLENISTRPGLVLNNSPLVVSREVEPDEPFSPAVWLSPGGVFLQTNLERERYGLPRFIGRDTLDQIALSKLNDMASSGYFAHISPSGVNIGEVAGNFGYRYAVMGENLAQGGFVSNEDLVEAWMASPGHRANILSSSFTEMGTAVRYVTFSGQPTWLAVQVFAKPLSACRQPNSDLRSQILSNQEKIDQEKIILAGLEEDIKNKPEEDVSGLVEEYNERVRLFNNLLRVTEASVVAYNSEVRSYNNCLGN